MAFGAAVATSFSLAAACTAGTGPLDGDGGVAETDGSDDSTATRKDASSDKPAIPDVVSENIAMPYGAPPADGSDLFV